MISTKKRAVMLLILTIFLALQIYAATAAAGGGWYSKYGALNAFTAYIDLSLADPIMFAGLVDFVTLGALAATLMISQLPKATRWSGATWGWLILFVIYPGLGTLVYFLWLNPGHSMMQVGKSKGP